MVFSIEKFSSTLCLIYGTDQVVSERPPQCFVLTDNSEDVHAVILKFSQMFENELHPIVARLTDTGTIDSFYSLTKVNLSLYVKLFENPTYFKLILLCSLVRTVVLETFASSHCYCLVKVFSLCLIAAYYRCYNDQFKEIEESESFGTYCRRLNISLNSEDDRNQLSIDLRQQGTLILESLEQVDFKNFSLSNYDKKLLNDALDLVAPEGDLPDDEVTTSTPYGKKLKRSSRFRNDTLDLMAAVGNLPEDAVTTTVPWRTDSSPTDASDAEVSMDASYSSGSEGTSSGSSDICFSCERRCIKYLDAFQKEVCEENV